MQTFQISRSYTSGTTMPTERVEGEMFTNFADETFQIKKNDGSSFSLVNKSTFDTHVLASVSTGDIVDDLTTGGSGSVLSAEQGKVLKGLVDNLNTLVNSNDVSLDTLQEIVDFIKLNRSDLDALTIASIAGLQAALDAKANSADVSTLPTYTVTNALTVRTFDANNVTIDRIADVVATLAADINGGLIWPQWPAGNDGVDGLGVPVGWTTSQVLSKASNADNDTAWTTLDLSAKEDVANKSTNMTTDTGSNTKYPSVAAVETYVATNAGWGSVTTLNTFTQLWTIISGTYGHFASGQAGTLAEVNVTYLNTAPTGSNATIEVFKNGTSIGTVTVTAGTDTGVQTIFSDTTIAKHDKFKFVVTEWSSVAGSGISINTIVS